MQAKFDNIAEYWCLLERGKGDDQMFKWAFLMFGVDISGGTNVIFQIALRLKKQGISVTFITEKRVERNQVSWNPIYESFDDHIFWKTYDEVKNEYFDVAIATYWKTFYSLYRVNAQAYTYFVQSIESRFYPSEEINLRNFVDKTYEPQIGVVTEAKWIKEYLANHYNHDAEYVRNGINKEYFNNNGISLKKRNQGKLRVLIEGPVNIAFKNVPGAIEACKSAEIEDVWLLTASDVKKYKDVNETFNKLPINRVSEIYRSCDVIVKLSYVEGMFGPPLEMFHCGGTAIVYNITGHDEYIQHEYNSLVAPVGDQQKVVEYLQNLKSQPALVETLKVNALQTAQKWPDWEETVVLYIKAMENAAKKCQVSQEELSDFSRYTVDLYERENTHKKGKWD
ncbi:MAG: hypothetical protein A3F13_07555 [Gammaproteobacteria bacterium RIFCSPHIGHO2_12_FULL_40_19]|nr:MAG: hypothetical protein A3F13_07555 [Gammaproteobacteria bacterium RIFCSPHIGHO2_12_FULL_40_19]